MFRYVNIYKTINATHTFRMLSQTFKALIPCINFCYTFNYKSIPLFIFQALLPIILGHNPAGTSVKTLIHFAQEITTSKFNILD